MEEIADISDRLIVMSELSSQFLEEIFKVPGNKIDMVPHGVPDLPFLHPNFYKDRFGVEGKAVLLTFGLLSPNKGIENVIKALSKILSKHWNVVYIGAADIYITPYRFEAQGVSGTLAYALGAGKAIISTSFVFAQLSQTNIREQEVCSETSFLARTDAAAPSCSVGCVIWSKHLFQEFGNLQPILMLQNWLNAPTLVGLDSRFQNARHGSVESKSAPRFRTCRSPGTKLGVMSPVRIPGKAGRFNPSTFLATIGAGRRDVRVARKHIVFSQGEAADAVFYVKKGKVRLTVVSKTGKEATIAILSDASFFGEGALAGQPLRMGSAVAMTDCELLRIDKKVMMVALHREHTFSDLFVAYLLARNIRYEEDLVDQLFYSSEKRLARVLLMLAHFGKEGVPETVVPKISQETLAEMIGTTRSRVSFFMNRFRKLGFIHYSGGIEGGLQVHSSLLNVVLYD
jgi:CRP/FNR family transcriptional regulator, cyclic AMP receptor protein